MDYTEKRRFLKTVVAYPEQMKVIDDLDDSAVDTMWENIRKQENEHFLESKESEQTLELANTDFKRFRDAVGFALTDFVVIYRFGGTRDCKWRPAVPCSCKAEALKKRDEVQRNGYLAIIRTVGWLLENGLPSGWFDPHTRVNFTYLKGA